MAEKETKNKSKCIHIWMLEPPNGKYSTGTCAKCGEVREKYFINSFGGRSSMD